jgi:hypothetical protein
VGAEGTGPDGQALAAWRSTCARAAQALRTRAQLDQVERAARPSDDRASGAAVSWVSGRDGAAPSVRLEPDEKRQLRAALAFSAPWLLGLLAALTVAVIGVLRTLVRWLWPEAVLLAALLGWQVVGPTAVVVLLLALGVIGRLVLVVLAVRKAMARQGRPVGVSGLRG